MGHASALLSVYHDREQNKVVARCILLANPEFYNSALDPDPRNISCWVKFLMKCVRCLPVALWRRTKQRY
jgi:hypothetical protein